ncbi:MAG: DUF3575 domain-containing protein [Bacteroides sp.]|nr:DUF3575 domain-containing protein [Bacteroides sp.]
MEVVPDPLSTTTMKLDLTGYSSSGKWSGEQNDSSETEVVTIHYRVSKIDLLKDYMDNARQLAIIDRTFSNISLVEDMDFVAIIGAASPEGYTDHNAYLGANRALAVKSYITTKFPYVNRDRLLTFSLGEDWDGFIQMIEEDPNVPAREELLEMLEQEQDPDTRRAKMKRINNGITYQYLRKHMLPYLRGGTACLIYFKKDKIPEPVPIVKIDTIYQVIYEKCPEVEEPVEGKPFYIALKNNLLFDLALLPNVAVEIPFGKNYRWSAEVEGHWSWWDSGANDYHFHRIQMAGLELRRWFGNKTGNPLNGWYVGAYGYGGTYDLRLFTNDDDDKGYLSNWSYSAGLSIGYAKPIGKRLNLEFGLGIGYFGGKYKKYDVSDCKDNTFPWLSTHDRNYVGLTKAKVSLVWLIGSGTNKKKGKEAGR